MQNSPSEQFLSIGDASEYLGISIDTLRRWTRKGKIVTHRSPGGHRYFKKSELDQVFGTRYEREEKKEQTLDVSSQTPVPTEQASNVQNPITDDGQPVAENPNPQSPDRPEPSLHNISDDYVQAPAVEVQVETPKPPVETVSETKQPLDVPRYIKHQNISKYDLLLSPNLAGNIEEKSEEEAKPVAIENFDFHPILIPSTHRPPTEIAQTSPKVEAKEQPKIVIQDVMENGTKTKDNGKLEKILRNSFLIFLALDAILFFFWFLNYRVNSPLP